MGPKLPETKYPLPYHSQRELSGPLPKKPSLMIYGSGGVVVGGRGLITTTRRGGESKLGKRGGQKMRREVLSVPNISIFSPARKIWGVQKDGSHLSPRLSGALFPRKNLVSGGSSKKSRWRPKWLALLPRHFGVKINETKAQYLKYFLC